MYARPIQQLIDAFSKLPSVGPRTAERFVLYLLKSGKKEVTVLGQALRDLVDNVKSCAMCFDFSDQSPCRICADHARDPNTLCIVTESSDLQAIERTQSFRGLYHVLRGIPDPLGDEGFGQLKIQELFDRVSSDTHRPREIIFALNPDVPGETTMLYLERVIRERAPQMIVSRLARGLPMGSDLRYADDITLGSALKHRVRQQ